MGGKYIAQERYDAGDLCITKGLMYYQRVYALPRSWVWPGSWVFSGSPALR